jgi:toxin ParE1/3/4
MHRVVWTREAEADLGHILAYYDDQAGPSVAESVFLRIRDELASLRQFPERCRPGRVAGTRELVIRRLPYIAVIHVAKAQVTVLAVVHTARKFP